MGELRKDTETGEATNLTPEHVVEAYMHIADRDQQLREMNTQIANASLELKIRASEDMHIDDLNSDGLYEALLGRGEELGRLQVSKLVLEQQTKAETDYLEDLINDQLWGVAINIEHIPADARIIKEYSQGPQRGQAGTLATSRASGYFVEADLREGRLVMRLLPDGKGLIFEDFWDPATGETAGQLSF